jgi:regulator of sigma E protease
MIEFLKGLTQLHNLFYSVLCFVVILTVLVFVHEFGHYIIARWNRVRIEVFSIGFGPELFGWWDRAGTRWKFSAIPLGGYVKMFGDSDATSGLPAPGLSRLSEASLSTTSDWASVLPSSPQGRRRISSLPS